MAKTVEENSNILQVVEKKQAANQENDATDVITSGQGQVERLGDSLDHGLYIPEIEFECIIL